MIEQTDIEIFRSRLFICLLCGLVLSVISFWTLGSYFRVDVAPYYLLFTTTALGFIFSNEALTFWPSAKYATVKKALFFALLATSVPLIIPVIPSNWFELQQVKSPLVVPTLNVSIATLAWLTFCIVAIFTVLRSRSEDV